MKKVLFATTALVLSAGIAAADVKISGYGRTGIDFNNNRGEDKNGAVMTSRLRMNIDASKTTDQGVELGGRIRLQWDNAAGDSTVNAGNIYASAMGLTVTVGNVTPAYDGSGLVYASEMGVFSRSYGDARGNFYGYSTRDFSGNMNGVTAEYAVDNLKARVSYVDPNQFDKNTGNKAEVGVSVDYSMDQFELSAVALSNAEGVDGNDMYFLGAAYAMNDSTKIGLNWYDNGTYTVNVRNGVNSTPTTAVTGDSKTITLWGSYGLPSGTTLRGYVANDNHDSNKTDNAFGIGAEHDLGGVMLMGSVQRGYQKETSADLGLKFSF